MALVRAAPKVQETAAQLLVLPPVISMGSAWIPAVLLCCTNRTAWKPSFPSRSNSSSSLTDVRVGTELLPLATSSKI